jgi:nicotinate-nucleotide adenylyltransferase
VKGERIGILGGTFDPVHIGHLVVANEARHQLPLDRVLLVVANQPWQKVAHHAVTPAEDRFAVVQAAVADLDGMEASRIELDRGGPSYTVDTVEALRLEYPEAELFLVVGSDVARDLETWEQVERLAAMVTLVVVDRAGVSPISDPVGWHVQRVHVPALELSSSDLRSRLAEGAPVEFLLPPDAIRCIRERGLYAKER